MHGRRDDPEVSGLHLAVGHAGEAVVGGYPEGKGKAVTVGGRRTAYIPEDLGFEVNPRHDAILAGVQPSLP